MINCRLNERLEGGRSEETENGNQIGLSRDERESLSFGFKNGGGYVFGALGCQNERR